MPVYNGEQYLAEAIDSILSQTFTDFEFIIINDGSTDGTAAILNRYAKQDTRIQIITNPSNLGLATSLNKGIETARGEYIARMDADDISLTHRFETQVRFMDAHPEIGICGSWVSTIGQTLSQTWKYPVHHNEIACQMLFDDPIAHPSVIMRQRIFQEHPVRYDGTYFPAEDYKLWSVLFPLTKLANIADVLLQYRVHTQQSTSAQRQKMLNGASRVRADQLITLFGSADVSSEDLAIHESLAWCRFLPTDNSLRSIHRWLRRLQQRNFTTGIYPEPLFTHTLARLWHRCCLEHSRTSLLSSYQFVISPYAYSSGLTWRNRLGFVIRSAQRRFSRS